MNISYQQGGFVTFHGGEDIQVVMENFENQFRDNIEVVFNGEPVDYESFDVSVSHIEEKETGHTLSITFDVDVNLELGCDGAELEEKANHGLSFTAGGIENNFSVQHTNISCI